MARKYKGIEEKQKYKYNALKIIVPVCLGILIILMIMPRSFNEHSLVYGYKIVNTYPHDPNAFTQGLVYEDGFLYEGTGLEELSTLRKVELKTGNIVKSYEMPDEYFGEGITIFGDKIIQLTYQSEKGFVYDKNTFELLREFDYPTEGWGITNNGKYLIMSDGTPTLYFLDPNSFKQTAKIVVNDNGMFVWRINELEFIDGKVYANIWETDRIAIIDPATGDVISWIDLQGLLSEEDNRGEADVLNGIAYDKENRRLFVTGKFWPKLFEIKLVHEKN